MHLIYEQNPSESTNHPVLRDPQTGQIVAEDPGVTLLQWCEHPTPSDSEAAYLILGDWSGAPGDDPDLHAQSWLQSWSQSGWERFDSAYRDAKRLAEPMGVELLLRPSSQGMLSDAVCTLNWCTRGAGQDASLLLDPLGWVVGSMVRDVDDHLDRIGELCVEMCEQGQVGCVLLRSIVHSPEDDSVHAASLGHGSVDTGLILDRLGPLLDRAPRIAVLDAADLGDLKRSGGAVH